MRIISLGLCTVLVLACGDGDSVQIDPDYRGSGARPGSSSDANAKPGPNGGGPAAPGPAGAGTPDPGPPACSEAPADACSAENPPGDAASTDAELSAGGSGSGSSGSAGDGNTGSGSTGSGAMSGAPGAGGTNGAAGSDGTSGSGGGNQAAPLPDLIIDGAYLMATIQQDTVDASADQCLFNEGCVTGDGLRRVVRFGTRSANVGAADVVVGEPVAGNPLWEYDVCHEHFHFEGYARYDLVDAGSGAVLPIGNKNGFCLRDLDSWNNPSCATYDCDYQGISVGCADVYTPDLDCQWVDITDVPPGLYDLVVTVNTERSIREQSFDNNSATVTIEILPTTIRVVP